MVGFRELVTALGRKVLLPDDPRRIISLSPAVTEILFELGLGGRIVGVSAFCGRPNQTQRIRKVGSYGSARLQAIRELRPDVIFTISGYPEEFSEKLGSDFPVYMFPLPSSVSGIIDLVNKVGIVTGRPEEASRIEVELSGTLAESRHASGMSAYLEIDLGGPVSFGFRSYINDALLHLGLSNIYGHRDKEWIEPDLEEVSRSDPDVIFYEPKMYSRFTDKSRERLLSQRNWNSLRSVTEGRFFVSPGPLDFIAHHGPAFIREVLPWMKARLTGTSEL